MKNSIFLILIFMITFPVNAYVISRTETGEKIKWKRNNKSISIFSNLSPKTTSDFILDKSSVEIFNLGLTTSQYIEQRTNDIVDESVGEWNQVSPYKLNLISTDQNLESDFTKNTITFTSSSKYFDSGVIAVTSLQYNPISGNINSANLLINQSYSKPVKFTLAKDRSSKSEAYIGDIITHEFGHFLGLGHSEVVDSSMIYSVFKGQHNIHSDDINGIKNNYNLEDSGVVKGRVMSGGSSPVFGAHAQIISFNTNKVIQSQLTEEDGSFYFDNLDYNDSYYILVSPVKNLGAFPEYYKNINNSYCRSSDFKPSFFTKCGGRDKGRPQLIKIDLDNEIINVGDITVRCDEKINTDYYANKYKSVDRSYELLKNKYDMNFLFNGYFSSEEISSGLSSNGDEFTIDLTNFTSDEFQLSNLFYNIKFASTSIGSNFEFLVKVKRIDQLVWSTYTASLDSETGKKLTDIEIPVSLSNDTNNNFFELKIFPLSLSTNEAYEIFASPSILTNKSNIYTISGAVAYFSESTLLNLSQPSSYPYEDNMTCFDGDEVYRSYGYVPLSVRDDAEQSAEDDNLGMSCATVDIGGGSSGGKMSFLLGLLFMIIIFNFQSRDDKSLSKF